MNDKDRAIRVIRADEYITRIQLLFSLTVERWSECFSCQNLEQFLSIHIDVVGILVDLTLGHIEANITYLSTAIDAFFHAIPFLQLFEEL